MSMDYPQLCRLEAGHVLPIVSLIQRPRRDGLQERSPLLLSLNCIAQHRRDDCLPDVRVGTIDLVRAQRAPKTSTNRSHD